MSEKPTTFLDQLSDAERIGLVARGTRRRYPANSAIFFVDEPAHETLIVLDGEVKAVVPALDGREVILGVLGVGSLLGELAALDGGTRSATIQTLGQTEVLAIPTDVFSAFLVEHPAVLHNLARVIAARLRDSDRRQLEFGTGDSISRLCARLVELADRYGNRDADGSIHVDSPLSQADLAAWSGLSREAVVKAMRALRSLGWIRNDGPSITLLDLPMLTERAER